MDYAMGFSAVLVGLLAGLVIGAFINASLVNDIHREAIAAGVAEYHIVDAESGETEFRFTPCEEQK